MHQLHSLLDQQSRLVVNPIMGLYIAAPWTTSIPIVNRKWTELMQIREQLWNFLQEQIDVRSSSKNFQTAALLSILQEDCNLLTKR